MKLLLDTADVAKIEQILPFFPIAGFTTNPSILAKETRDVKATLLRLRELAGDGLQLHAQVTASAADAIVRQATEMQEALGGSFYAKIPITVQGLRAVGLCKKQGIPVTVTAVFTPMQALLAAMAGADYVAPYVDRLDNITSSGVTVVKEIVDLFTLHKLPCQVLAASFKNVQQVFSVASMGAQAATVSCELCMKLLFHPYTDKSLEDFDFDWRCNFGDVEITDLLR